VIAVALPEELLELDEELLELELLLELDEELLEPELPLIEPDDGVSVTRSSFAPSSRRSMYSVWLPLERLLNVVGFSVLQPLVCVLFCVFHEPESIL